MDMIFALLLVLQEGDTKKYEETKIIVTRNIFAPYVAPKKVEEKKPKEETKPKKEETKPVEPSWPVVTGFEAYPDGAQILVTDRSKNESRRYKVGESLCGGKIVSIDAVRAVIEFPTGKLELRNGDPVKTQASPTTITKIGWIAAAATRIPSAAPEEAAPGKKRASDQMEEEDPTPRKKKLGNRP